MKLIVKKKTLVYAGLFAVIIIGAIYMFVQVIKDGKQALAEDRISQPIGRITPDATVEADTDEMVRKGIEESDQQWKSQHAGSKDWYPELVKARQRTRDIYDAQVKVNKSIDEIKDLRKRIVDEFTLWHTFRNSMSDVQLEANEKVFTDYTDNISLTATRQRLLEQQAGLDWNIDTKEYKEETNGE